MSAHATLATCRCLWCKAAFTSPAEAQIHMHMVHAGNFVRTLDDEAAAKMQHYHADREAVRKGRPVHEDRLDTPEGVGRALAEKLAAFEDDRFLRELAVFTRMISEDLVAAGKEASTAASICAQVRGAALRRRREGRGQ